MDTADSFEPVRVDEDIYTLFLARLPKSFPDRLNLASVAGYMPPTGGNVTRIAAAMKRSPKWVRERIAIIEDLLYDDHADHYRIPA